MRLAILTGFASLLLLGAGCGSAEAPEQEPSDAPVVLKAPEGALDLSPTAVKTSTGEQACTSRGFEVLSRFEELTETTRKYCQFDDGSECPLDEYAAGTCGPGQGATSLTNPGLITNQFTELICDDGDPPVCGTNGHSYENKCIATQVGIEIASVGMCDEAIIEANAKARKTSETNRANVIERAKALVSKKSNGSGAGDVPPPVDDPEIDAALEEAPEWLGTVIALIEADTPTSPRTYVDACVHNGKVVYHETNGTDNIPSTLYNANGAIKCNPNRDFGGLCPNFDPAKSGCERVYTDER